MDRKVFAAILAGGCGSRMGNSNKPKQYFMLGDKPIISHTIDKFALFDTFEKILVLTPDVWQNQTHDIIEKYSGALSNKIEVLQGGLSRNDTILNACNYIIDNYPDSRDAIIVTHDAVRPFINYRIIRQNIDAVIAHGACDTVIPASDTIVESRDGKSISKIPLRKNIYQGQTPQSFIVSELKDILTSLTQEERDLCTDACKAYLLRERSVAIVQGDVTNIKITYPTDMLLAKALLGEIETNEEK